MKRRALLVLAALAAPAVHAQEIGVLYPQVFLTSDYRFDGLSSSNRKPTMQFSLYLWRPDGWYGGLWLSGVDYQEGRNTWLETDLYLGKHFTDGDTRYTLEVMGSFFPTQEGPGPTYDFVQFNAKIRHTMDRLELNGELAWTPSASAGNGQAWKAEAGLGVVIAEGWTAGASWGVRSPELGFERQYWEAGLTYTIDDWAFDLRWYDTDLESAECFYTDWCEGGFAAKVTYTLPMIVLG